MCMGMGMDYGVIMINPCKQCIINPMCQQYCDDLKQYLNKVLTGEYFDRYNMMSVLAFWYREGIVELYSNDTQWRISKSRWSNEAREYTEGERWTKTKEYILDE